MKFKKNYKYVLAVCFVLLAIVLIILFKSDITIFKSSEKKSVNKAVTDVALIISDKCDSEDNKQLDKILSECVKKYEKKYSSYNVSDYDNSYKNTIVAAINQGATLVICPDASFEETVYELQSKYITISFLLVDGTPHNTDYTDSTINFNVISMNFNDAEAGFLAGYAAVYEGNKELAFIGLKDDTQSVHYCYGFLQGADYAAADTGSTDINVTISYIDKENVSETADKLYSSGIDLIVACSRDIVSDCEKSAEKNKKFVISCGDNHPIESEYIIANTTKNICLATKDCVDKFYSFEISAGNTQNYSSSNNSIALNFKTADFTHFDSKIYDSIYQKLASGEVRLISDTTVAPEDLELEHIVIH